MKISNLKILFKEIKKTTTTLLKVTYFSPKSDTIGR
jgi:hypothetical protein